MPKCANCGSTLLWIKKKVEGFEFCNDQCVANGRVIIRGKSIPDANVELRAVEMAANPCPVCKGPGPIDVHTSHFVWSILVMTSWKSTPRVSCRTCGVKDQSLSLLGSAVAGWWGFPWGLIVTPIQITRNVVGLVASRSHATPSADLRRVARHQLAAEALARERSA